MSKKLWQEGGIHFMKVLIIVARALFDSWPVPAVSRCWSLIQSSPWLCSLCVVSRQGSGWRLQGIPMIQRLLSPFFLCVFFSALADSAELGLIAASEPHKANAGSQFCKVACPFPFPLCVFLLQSLTGLARLLQANLVIQRSHFSRVYFSIYHAKFVSLRINNFFCPA